MRLEEGATQTLQEQAAAIRECVVLTRLVVLVFTVLFIPLLLLPGVAKAVFAELGAVMAVIAAICYRWRFRQAVEGGLPSSYFIWANIVCLVTAAILMVVGAVLF